MSPDAWPDRGGVYCGDVTLPATYPAGGITFPDLSFKFATLVHVDASSKFVSGTVLGFPIFDFTSPSNIKMRIYTLVGGFNWIELPAGTALTGTNSWHYFCIGLPL